MGFANEASKLLTNKYFLYFMVFLSATTVLGYLVTNKLNAVMFFALVALLTYQFSKNMSVVLLVPLIATSFLVSNKRLYEGLENKTTDTQQSDKKESQSLSKASSNDPEIAAAVNAVKTAKTNDEAKTKLSKTVETALDDDSTLDINNPNLNKKVSEPNEPVGAGQKMSKNTKDKKEEHFGPRLDYAATIEQSYQNLDELLGSDSIQKLSTDTQKLMAQQQNLFNTMNQMVPVLEGAQNMLKGFDMNSLTDSLKKMGHLGNASTVV